MKRLFNPNIIARILLPLIIIMVLGISPRSHEATEAIRQANLFVESGNHSEAAKWLANAAEQLPYRADLWENAGQQAALAGKPSLAIDYFNAASAAGKLSAPGYIELGQAYQQIGDLSLAIQTWQTGLSKYEPDPQIYWLLAGAQRQVGDYQAAIQNLQALTMREPSNAAGQYQLGLLLAATEPRSASATLLLARQLDSQYAERIAILQSALRSAQFENPPAYVFTVVGQALGALDEWDLAAAAFLQATEHDPTYAEAWAYLGEAQQQNGESGQAELEVAWALNPESLSANILLSLYWQRQNQMGEALFYLGNAAVLEPTNPALQADLGALYLRMGDQARALQFYQRATELSPREARYWILLATFSIEHEIYIEEAGLPAAQQAYELTPNDAAVATLLGRAYYLLGDYVIAADFYLHALTINPDYAPTHLYLGLLYITIGELENGRLELLKVIELDGDEQFGVYAQQLLAQYFR